MGGRDRSPEQTQGHAQKQKNIKGRPSSARGTQTATATKVADFRKYPLSKTPKTRVLGTEKTMTAGDVTGFHTFFSLPRNRAIEPRGATGQMLDIAVNGEIVL